ncbi:MAG: radical SAM protein [Thermodesulfobacteriota bacterium]
MCLTIPAKIIKASEGRLLIDGPGGAEEVEAPFTTGLRPGDWVLHINRLVIRRISGRDAREIISLLESGAQVDASLLSPGFRKAVEAVHSGRFDASHIVYLLGCVGQEKEALFKEADTVRKVFLKDFICIHGIIEFSNHCLFNCLYCGLRACNPTPARYRMAPGEIVETAVAAVREKGYKLLVLQAGEDPFYTDAVLVDIIGRIKASSRVFIFISAGERGFESYRSLKEAGASGVLFRFETSNKNLFEDLHPEGKGFSSRFSHLEFFKDLGYYIATGSITGLPGQSLDDIAEDILTTKKWADMVSTGPFVPSPGTPLEGLGAGDPELHLKVIAVLRLVMKSARIPVVTAYETIAEGGGEAGRMRALKSGANSIMVNLTPEKYRPLYTIYPERFHDEESIFVKYGLFKYRGSFDMLEKRMAEEISGADE